MFRNSLKAPPWWVYWVIALVAIFFKIYQGDFLLVAWLSWIVSVATLIKLRIIGPGASNSVMVVLLSVGALIMLIWWTIEAL